MLLDTIHLLAEMSLDPSFLALANGTEDYWLLPLRREAITNLVVARDIDHLVQFGTAGELPGIELKPYGGQRGFEVICKLGGQEHRQVYAPASRHRATAGNTLDIRMWPNFLYLHEPLLPARPADRHYYFRIRQQEDWNLSPQVLVRLCGPAGEFLGLDYIVPDNTGAGWPDAAEPFRLARFYSFPAEGAPMISGRAGMTRYEPVGLYFEGWGLVLFRLPPGEHPGGDPELWRIGVDFGTSNTSVAFRRLLVDAVSHPQPLLFDIQTVALHALPVYERLGLNADGNTIEGAAAIFDFPYRYADERLLTEQAHFPTQLVTRQKAPPNKPNFRMAHGLIFPRNVVMDNADSRGLLKSYPPLPPQDSRVFRLLHDLKWVNRAYRPTFLWHLYKMVVLHAARNGARIAEAAFSFPRAFNQDEIRHFSDELRAIFKVHGGIRVEPQDIISESAAVQLWIQTQKAKATADQLVLDVGGGTTDFLGIIQGRPAFQASYSSAGGCVNQYFQSSQTLRRLLREAVYQAVGQPADNDNRLRDQRKFLDGLLEHLDQLPKEEQEKIEAYSEQAFFGLMSMLGEPHWPRVGEALRQPPEALENETDRRAIRGFFLTLALLYGGLAYQAARLMYQYGIMSTNLQHVFIGNGSRYCRLLGDDQGVTRPWMEEIFRCAGPNPRVDIKKPDVRFHGKAIVAQGLVSRTDGLRAAPVLPDKPSLEWLTALAAGDGRASRAKTALAEEMSSFIRLMDRIFPSGQLGGTVALPYCEQSLETELEPLLAKVGKRSRPLEKAQGEKLRQALDHARANEAAGAHGAAAEWLASAHATQPVFITRLRCLLDLVRDRYAGSASQPQ